ncbi:ketopantoate reductase family protein [Nakamurella leprariae]|uniref:Ketopantoate reductase family protein n=1 Tax=Nakamurella leprariae TaxID=2803911 RepID=A0A938YIF9_9ACTN|nr:ketopantoate reductase family protein [Nakamurella leprariae]MBM9468438.1 ketopantoate reductase family protein [Nakamurella leprariae]
MTRYVIIGAGAVGGTIGGALARTGQDVLLVARGRHAEVMREDGLTLRTPDGAFTVHPPVITDPAEADLTVDDVLVLTVKTHQAVDVLPVWADLPVWDAGTVVGTAGERLPIITALNGVVSEDLASRWFRTVLGCCVWLPAIHLEPGEVIVRSAPVLGMLHIGPVPLGPAPAALTALQQPWTDSGIRVALPADVMPWKYRKLISNLGNGLQAVLGDDHPALAELTARAEVEAREVLAAAGIELVDEDEHTAARADSLTPRPVPGEPERLGGSSWQSLARGTGSIETDYLNGEIVRIAHRLGREAPVDETVARMCRRAATIGAAPGELAGQLLDALGVGS